MINPEHSSKIEHLLQSMISSIRKIAKKELHSRLAAIKTNYEQNLPKESSMKGYVILTSSVIQKEKENVISEISEHIRREFDNRLHMLDPFYEEPSTKKKLLKIKMK